MNKNGVMPLAAMWMHHDLFLIGYNFSVSLSDKYYCFVFFLMHKSFSAGHKDQQLSKCLFSRTELSDLSTFLRIAS